MARYKDVNYRQQKLIPISFESQILPGTFEYTLNYLIDNEIDLSLFDSRYNNDETGAPAFNPAVLLKIILFAYSRGITSSREIENACRENVVFMALSADSKPHFTTIAAFISTMSEQIVPLFRNVLWICDELKLIGKDMFAIDGCKMPSNAAKEWSGTKYELKQKQMKLEKAARHMLARHRETDLKNLDQSRFEKEQRAILVMKAKARKIKQWLNDNDDKPGKTGKPKKSNITDNDSAKMKTSKGVIQGFDGVAAVDSKHQIIVEAHAYGEAQEHDLLQPMIEQVKENFQSIKSSKRFNIFIKTKVTTDSGFYSKANLEYLNDQNIDAYLPDLGFRKRDPRFADAERYRERYKKDRQQYQPRQAQHYTSPDFYYDETTHTCICPAGQKLYSNGRSNNLGGYEALRFRGSQQTCAPCSQRHRCMKDPNKTKTRQVAIFIGRSAQEKNNNIELMKQLMLGHPQIDLSNSTNY